MASKVTLTLTWGSDSAIVTLFDPVGTINSWSCDPPEFLSKGSGKWHRDSEHGPWCCLMRKIR